MENLPGHWRLLLHLAVVCRWQLRTALLWWIASCPASSRCIADDVGCGTHRGAADTEQKHKKMCGTGTNKNNKMCCQMFILYNFGPVIFACCLFFLSDLLGPQQPGTGNPPQMPSNGVVGNRVICLPKRPKKVLYNSLEIMGQKP